MNEMQVFSSEQFGEIRTIERNGEVWFVATDVCRALELGNPSETVKRLDKDELTSVQLRSDTQKREMNIINEPGLYSLILGSRKPEARAFKRWVTHEVLPSIRRTGAYIANSDALINMIRKEHQQISQLARQIEVLKGEVAALAGGGLPAQHPYCLAPAAPDAQRETQRFIDVLNQILQSGEARLRSLCYRMEAMEGELIGYADDAYFYLYPVKAYDAVARRCLADGRALMITRRMLYRRLREMALVAVDPVTGVATRAKWIDGHTRRLLWLARYRMEAMEGDCDDL